MLAQRRGNYLRTLLLILLVVQVCVLLVYFRSFAPQWFTTSDQVPDSATKSSNRDDGDSHLWKVRQNAVKTAFRRAWDSYSHDAWGKDEYHSQSRSGINLSPAGYGFTIVDTLDTLLLMGLHDEFAKAREYVKHNLTFYQPNSPVSTFETTIRVLGGLLSAHYLTHTMLPKDERSDENAVFLERAVELADELVYSFNTPTGLPREKTYLQSAKSFERLHSMPTYEIEAEHGSGGTPAQRKQHKDTYSVCAVGGTMQLELEYLSYLTKNATYAKTARRAYNFLTSRRSMDGIQPLGLDVLTGEYDSSTYRFTIGAEIDSYYEYMIKQHLMFNGTPSRFKRDFDRAVAGVRKHLVRYTSKSKHVYVTELTFSGGDFTKPNAKRHELNQMGHLACYFPAALILSATGGKPLAAASMAGNSNSSNKADSGIDSDLDFARELLRTCVDGTLTPVTGLAPEMWRFVSNVSRSIAYSAPHLRQHLPALPATAKPGQNSADPANPA
ncbi:seven-hairpin glycosidase, partial [Ramicandelaber brevisporus]